MSFRTDIRDAAASIHASLSQDVLGEVMTYSKRGAAPVTVYGIPEGESKQLSGSVEGNSKLDQEETEKSFKIARQSTFPPTGGVSITDVIAWNGTNWDVVKADIGSLGAVWKLQCVRQKMRRIGA